MSTQSRCTNSLWPVYTLTLHPCRQYKPVSQGPQSGVSPGQHHPAAVTEIQAWWMCSLVSINSPQVELITHITQWYLAQVAQGIISIHFTVITSCNYIFKLKSSIWLIHVLQPDILPIRNRSLIKLWQTDTTQTLLEWHEIKQTLFLSLYFLSSCMNSGMTSLWHSTRNTSLSRSSAGVVLYTIRSYSTLPCNHNV